MMNKEEFREKFNNIKDDYYKNNKEKLESGIVFIQQSVFSMLKNGSVSTSVDLGGNFNYMDICFIKDYLGDMNDLFVIYSNPDNFRELRISRVMYI